MYPPPSPYANGCFTLACFQSNTTGEKVEPPFNMNLPRDYFSGRPPSPGSGGNTSQVEGPRFYGSFPVHCFTSSPYGFSQGTQMNAQLFRDDPALAKTCPTCDRLRDQLSQPQQACLSSTQLFLPTSGGEGGDQHSSNKH
mmetsp:Transcript_33881/g.76133  ORF Transcript_33881/g.76133 Transcript_33881/m.76133 type:complete len:140 (+) Transcript_33881:310-729(+)